MLRRDLGIDHVAEAGSFDQVLNAIAQDQTIAMVTIDLDLPGMRGLERIRQLRIDYPQLRVVIVALMCDRETMLDALCAGIHGYIPKHLPSAEMLVAFRSVLAGQIYVPPLVSDLSAKRIVPRAVSSRAQRLTDRQFKVLGLLAAGRSNKEIARALCIAEGTVKVHITAAFRTLGVHNRVSAAAALHGLSEAQMMPGTVVPVLLSHERAAEGHNGTIANGVKAFPLAN